MPDRITVYISIGNSDDKLSQADWAAFYRSVNLNIRGWAWQIHGQWVSEPASAWQNACWCVEVLSELAVHLRGELSQLAAQYRQDSIAWAVAETEFIKPTS
jgi:hypothetical protein